MDSFSLAVDRKEGHFDDVSELRFNDTPTPENITENITVAFFHNLLILCTDPESAID